MTSTPLVLYHADCADVFTAARIAYYALTPTHDLRYIWH